MLAARVATGAVFAGIFVAVLWLDERLAPWYPLWLILSLVLLGASAVEVVNLFAATSAKPSGNTVFGGVIALVVANWAPHVAIGLASRELDGAPIDVDPMFAIHVFAWPMWMFVVIVMLSFIVQSVQFSRPGGGTMATIAGTVLAAAYVGLLGSFTIQMRWLYQPYHGMIPLAALIATSKGADTGAYTIGRILGKTKLWPRLSPNKTVEGAIGGMIAGVLASSIVFAVARFILGAKVFHWDFAIGYGIVVGATAQLGDLMESMIKRDCARKDASDALPGFGGVLDVLDSILFAGPVAYGFWLAFGP